MLGADDMTVAADAIEAAKRVMTAADPDAPLLMLAMAHKTLNGVLRRQARNQRLRAAWTDLANAGATARRDCRPPSRLTSLRATARVWPTTCQAARRQ